MTANLQPGEYDMTCGRAYLVMGVLNGLILIFVRPLVGIYELSGETMELSIILACIHAGFVERT